jgi:hypothetical protein
MKIREWLTALEIGQELGVDGSTVRTWIKNGLIDQKYVLVLPHKQRGALRIHVDALQAMIQSSQSISVQD